MPVIDTRVISQEMGEHLNLLMARSVDHRALETLAVGEFHLFGRCIFSTSDLPCRLVLTIVFGVGGYMYYAIKVQSK